MTAITRFTTVVLTLLSFAVNGVTAQEPRNKSGYDSDPGFGAPGSTADQLAEDDLIKEPAFRFPAFDQTFQPWFDWKGRLNREKGLQLGVAYTSLLQAASGGPDEAEDDAGSGIFRLSARWKAYNPESGNNGELVMSADHRHAYGDLAPADLGFSVGYLGIPGVLFNDAGSLMGDLNWQQRLNGGRGGLVIGRYDPNDFLDVLGYANPWTTFQNLAILFNASIALPDWGTGAGIGNWFNDQFYAIASVSDANGVASETRFFEDFGELYSTAEFGWSPSRAERYFSNVHLMVWHADEREEAMVEESEGFTVSANWTWDQRVMLFFKGGWSDGSAPIYNESVTIGTIYSFPYRSDLFGAAVNWGEPPGSDDSQVTTEVFYRLQLAENLAITPSLQYLVDPALNPEEDDIWIGSLRIRFSF